MALHQLNLVSLVSAFCAYEIEWIAARYGVRQQDLEVLRDLVQGPRAVKRGEVLYRERSRSAFLYTIARGSFKSGTVSASGREYIADLHFEGDFLGLEAIAERPQRFTVEALEASQVFSLDAGRLREAMGTLPGLEEEMLRLMSREVWKQEEHRLLLHEKEASARLAAFLLYLSHREQENGGDPRELRLQMSRHDLAGFLGLATETVSRLLSRFAVGRLIGVRSRRIELIKLREISRIAGRRYLLPLLLISLLAEPLLM